MLTHSHTVDIKKLHEPHIQNQFQEFPTHKALRVTQHPWYPQYVFPRIAPWPPHGPLDMKLQGEQAELVLTLATEASSPSIPLNNGESTGKENGK